MEGRLGLVCLYILEGYPLIGMSGSYDDQIEIVDYEGTSFIGYGVFTVADLEQLNKQVESG